MKPLRTIVETKPGPHSHLGGALTEVLECGHEQKQKVDHYGLTNAYKRRCRKCCEIAEGCKGAEK